MRTTLHEKTGMVCYGRGGLIFCEKGKLVYQAEGNGKKFNLPKGTYIHDLELRKCQPVDFELPQLPEKERNHIRNPKTEVVRIEKNPHKATINPKKGIITIDPLLLRYPKYVFDFVVWHEVGHYYYATEWKCDTFAARKMLEMGWNPSNVSAARYLVNSEMRRNKVGSLLENFEK